jgi:hypothetical protein
MQKIAASLAKYLGSGHPFVFGIALFNSLNSSMVILPFALL